MIDATEAVSALVMALVAGSVLGLLAQIIRVRG